MVERVHGAAHALDALLAFDAERDSLGVSELARRLGCSTSTAQRAVNTLCELQFLRRDDQTRRYYLGTAVLQLTKAWNRASSLKRFAEPIIIELAATTGLVATFAVPDHAHMRSLVACDGKEGALRGYPMGGELFPAHAGAISKVYYAQLPEKARARFVTGRPMAKFTATTTTDPLQLEQEFRKIARVGYCSTHGEYDEAVSALAVPVLVKDDPLGAISVATRGDLVVDSTLIAQCKQASSDLQSLLSLQRRRR